MFKYRNRKDLIDNYGIKVITTICVAIILAIGLQGILQLKQLVVINDEFGYWSIAAHLAGYDWSGLAATTPYYAYGYSLLLVPLFWLFEDPAVMYQAAIVLNVIMLCSSFLLLVRSGKKLFQEEDTYFITLAAFTVTLYANNIAQVKIAWTETLLYFLFILIVNLIINMWEKPTIINIVSVAAASIYIYMVHQRSLGILVASILMICLLFFRKKITIKKLMIVGICFCLGFFITVWCKQYFSANLWVNPELSAVNDFSGQAVKVKSIFSLVGIKLLAESVFGKLFYVLTATFLIAGGGLIFIVEKAFIYCRNIVKKEKQEVNIQARDARDNVYIYLCLSFLSTLAISAIYMLQPTRLDMLVYGRYLEFVYGPILLCGFMQLYKKGDKIKWVFGLIIFVSIMGNMVQNIFLQLSSSSFNALCGVGIYTYFTGDWRKNGVAVNALFMSILVFGILLVIKSEKNRRRKFLSIFTISLICIFLWIQNADVMLKDTVYYLQNNVSNNIAPIAEQIKEGGINQEVYFVEEKSEVYNVQDSIKQMQYLLYNLRIVPIGLEEIKTKDFSQEVYFLILKKSKDYGEMARNLKLVGESEVFGLFVQK